jgi:hypothetical protein
MPDLLKRLLASPESRFLLSNFATYGQTRPAGTACSTAVPRWFADTEQVTSWSVGGQARTEPEVGPTTVVDEAVVRTPNFTPDGRQRPAQTLVRTAVGCHLLARRKPGVQIPSPPPPTLQVRASSVECRRRSLHVAAALRPPAQVKVQLESSQRSDDSTQAPNDDHGG